MLIETAIVALTTFIATIGPVDVSAIFASMTRSVSVAERRVIAIRCIIIASIILLLFSLIGEFILAHMGISLAALKTAGGILLLLIGIDMAYKPFPEQHPTSKAANHSDTTDMAAFPLATPLIAGPGAMGAVILLMGNTEGSLILKLVVILSLLISLILTFLALLLASKIQQYLGMTFMRILTRLFGVLLCALAMQFIFDGIALSGLLNQ